MKIGYRYAKITVCVLGWTAIGLSAVCAAAQGAAEIQPPADPTPTNQVYIRFGDPRYSVGDEYLGPGPEFFTGCWQEGGQFVTNVMMWRVPASAEEGVGRLSTVFDRALLTNDLTMQVGLYSFKGSELLVDLLSTNETPVLTNLVGSLSGDTNGLVRVEVDLPFRAWPEASQVTLRRSFGEIVVLDSLFYVPEPVIQVTTAVEDERFGPLAVPPVGPTNVVLSAEELAAQNPDGDDDGDGICNLAEYRLGMDPRVPVRPDTTGEVNLKVLTRLE